MKYYVNQNKQILEQQVSPSLLKKIYDDIIEHELTGEFYDNTTNLIGSIQLSSPTYEVYVSKINSMFPNLEINGEFYILFQDDNVKNIMIQHLLSKGVGDGIGISTNNANDKLVTSLPSTFINNTNIEYFNELSYFERITSLLDSNFYHCTNLKEIDLSNITTLNGQSTFSGCTNLEKVILGNIRNIPSYCFNNCTHLENIVNSENIVTISNDAFINCSYLENINLSNVTTIGAVVFYGCSSLKQVDLSKCITIGDEGFRNCTQLTIKNNTLNAVITLGNNVFVGCSNIEEINLPNCTSIGNGLFAGAQAIETITMPNITVIPTNAFNRCRNLQNIDFSNIQNIGDYAFYECTSLQSVDLTNIRILGIEVFTNCGNLTLSNSNLNNCTTIKERTFQSTKITNINLPNLTTLNEQVFRYCKQLQSINIPLLTEIKYETFNGCESLSSITCGSLTSIGNYAFYECKLLQSIDLSNCTFIGKGAFAGCVSLSNITNLSKCTSIGEGAFQNTQLSGSIILNKLTSIEAHAFRNTNIEKIDFRGSTFTSVPSYLFYSPNSNIKEVRLPTTVTYLNEFWCLVDNNNTNAVKLTGLDNVESTYLYNYSLDKLTHNLLYPIALLKLQQYNGLIQVNDNKSMNAHSLFLPKVTTTSDAHDIWYGFIKGSEFQWISMGNGRCNIKLLYYKDITTFGYATFCNLICDNLVINNVTPPTYHLSEDTTYQPAWQSLLGDGTRASIGTLWVPDEAVATYQADPVYASLNIKGINTKTNGVDYDLPRYATFDDWEVDALIAEQNNEDYPVALIEEYM